MALGSMPVLWNNGGQFLVAPKELYDGKPETLGDAEEVARCFCNNSV